MTSFVTALSNNPLGKISMRGGEEDKKMETSMLEVHFLVFFMSREMGKCYMFSRFL